MSQNPNRVGEFLNITSRLIGVLEEEVSMLRAMQPARMQDLQQDKIVLAAAYEASVLALQKQPDLVKSLSPDLREQLRSVNARFHKVLSDNERALAAAKTAADSLLQHVLAEVERQRGATNGYAANGAMATIAGRTGRGGTALAIDQSL